MDLKELQEAAASCTSCELHEGRVNPVFAKGDPSSSIMVCGMVPAKEENKVGLPFVGRAGKLLDDILLDVSIPEGSVYITNLVKCFLAAGLPLKQDWIDNCLPYLILQIDWLRPKIIITLGKDASLTLLGMPDRPLGQIRGRVFDVNQRIKVIPTYHPSYLLRSGGKNSKQYSKVISDFTLAKELSC
ncbi:MAG: uracil-DNA glycosylase [Gammaproteobacteria bacterium]|nr:MAG: uracil-DNA glycosylase [Gammaproteobacteria bacterium]